MTSIVTSCVLNLKRNWMKNDESILSTDIGSKTNHGGLEHKKVQVKLFVSMRM